MLDSYIVQEKQESDERIAVIVHDKKLGKVFYPSYKAIKDGIEKSMA